MNRDELLQRIEQETVWAKHLQNICKPGTNACFYFSGVVSTLQKCMGIVVKMKPSEILDPFGRTKEKEESVILDQFGTTKTEERIAALEKELTECHWLLSAVGIWDAPGSRWFSLREERQRAYELLLRGEET